jgi:HJR/Mrr/RecB family endonuclease
MVITNNYFTPAAFKLAKANNIELVDRNGLEKMINKHW